MTSATIIRWLLGETLHIQDPHELLRQFSLRLSQLLAVKTVSLDFCATKAENMPNRLVWKNSNESSSSSERKNYFVLPMSQTRDGKSYITIVPSSHSGFSDSECDLLKQICPALSTRFEVEFYHQRWASNRLVESYWQTVLNRCKKTTDRCNDQG